MMALFKNTRQIFARFLTDKRGNISILAAFALLPIMVSVGAAIDFSRGAQIKSQITSATDAALLSAASSAMKEGLIKNADSTTAKDAAKISTHLNMVFGKFFKANMGDLANSITPKLIYDPKTQNVIVNINLMYKTAFGNFLTPDMNISVVSAINMKSASQGALSMMLVLDKSGSMGWQNRMNILKVAINDLANQFEDSDPKHEFVRLGAIAYDSNKRRASRPAWGATNANNYVRALRPGGGTNSSSAMMEAYNRVKHNREDKAHKDKNGQVPKKYIVLLTDGSNNRSQYDTATLRTCTKAKKAEIEIYTVAFQAPARGQLLLKRCASSAQHYFLAANAKDLIKAFRQIGAAASKSLRLTQ